MKILVNLAGSVMKILGNPIVLLLFAMVWKLRVFLFIIVIILFYFLIMHFSTFTSVLRNCTPLITNYKALWSCLNNTVRYNNHSKKKLSAKNPSEKELMTPQMPQKTDSQKECEENDRENPYCESLW